MAEEKEIKFLSPKKSSSILRFTPYAFAKLQYMRDKGDTEVGGFGITATEDPMLVTDFKLVPQKCSSVTVDIEGRDVNDFMNKMMDEGIAPWQCTNVWIHTHPGNCAKPSGVDEKNFSENFGSPHWVIFYILAKDGDEYCRIRFNIGPGLDCDIEVDISYGYAFPGSNVKEWDKEYKDNITEEKFPNIVCVGAPKKPVNGNSSLWMEEDYDEDKYLRRKWPNKQKNNDDDNEFLDMIADVKNEQNGFTINELPDYLTVIWIDESTLNIQDCKTEKEYEFDINEDVFSVYKTNKKSNHLDLVLCDDEPEWANEFRMWLDELAMQDNVNFCGSNSGEKIDV